MTEKQYPKHQCPREIQARHCRVGVVENGHLRTAVPSGAVGLDSVYEMTGGCEWGSNRGEGKHQEDGGQGDDYRRSIVIVPLTVVNVDYEADPQDHRPVSNDIGPVQDHRRVRNMIEDPSLPSRLPENPQ